ncbi:MAG: DUF2318 domain-containing protein [Propionibacteriaceae bacterium]|jgi:uncharacterized membrane protein|nr:DUF2318 domain-containing protein [Propionibacteriaceae bacterium]
MLNQLVQVVAGAAPTLALLALLGAWVVGASSGAATLNTPNRNTTALRWGIALGTAAAITLALLRETTRLINRELVTFSSTSALILLEVLLLAFVWYRTTTANKPPTGISAGIMGAVAALIIFTTIPSVLLQLTGFFVPGQPVFTTATLGRIVGFLLGFALVVLTGMALIRAAENAPLKVITTALSVGIGVMLVSQGVTLTQVAVARTWLKLPTQVFKALIWAINQQGLVLLPLLLAVLLAPLWCWRANRAGARADASGDPKARLAKAAARRRLNAAKLGLFGVAAILFTVTAGAAIANHKPELSDPEPYDIVGTQAIVPLETVNDGHLHRFAYETTSGVTVRFIVVQKNAVAYGVGLDACEICGPTGYLERAGQIICRLCDVVMNIATIGFRGGCNPIPLEYTIVDGALVVDLADLEAAAPIFA